MMSTGEPQYCRDRLQVPKRQQRGWCSDFLSRVVDTFVCYVKARLFERIKRTSSIIFPLLFSTMERIDVVHV